MRVVLELNPKDWWRLARYRWHEWRFKRVQAKDGVFKDNELIYSASSHCACGAGLAYPRGCGAMHYWDCSDILTGRAIPGKYRHTDKLPFVLYEIKSENQPSANGRTSRNRRPPSLGALLKP